jgi:hypothetical protein
MPIFLFTVSYLFSMKTHKNHHFRQILAASLALGSSFGMISPVLAQAAAAGTAIKNTATASFDDGTGKTYNVTSNEVVITVAEVAGVTITPQSPFNASPSAGDDTVYVDFVITNIGNDPTQFFIPDTATLDNTTAFQLSPTRKIQIVAVDGTAITPKDVPAGGAATGDASLLGGTATQGSIAPNPGTGTTGTITVRVPIKVLAGAAAGQTLKVSLGETSPVDGSNTDRAGNVNATKDVYTVDNPDTVTGETKGTPAIVREAMATSTAITIGARQQAFSTVLKAISSYSTGTLPDDVSDDVLTYALALKVENPSTPPTGLVASDLYGTKINGLDPAKAYVLVSDAIPTGMKLGTANPVPPSGWTVVYTTEDLTTKNALQASWSTTNPGTGITRIGFVKEATSAATAIPKGTTVSGFNFTVTPDTGFASGQIANIAQTFGQSLPGTVVAGTPTQIVYDESGDQTFNNGLDGADPDPTGATAANGGITDGKANPVLDGTDPGTYDTTNSATQDPTNPATNKGTDPGTGSKAAGGEDTIFNFAKTPVNGPNGQPEALGPTNNNDDFTNQSIEGINKPSNQALTDGGTSATDETPPVTFKNTVKNTSASPQEITLLPTPPTGSDILLEGTKVTITDSATGGQAASYTYKGGVFVPDAGTTAPVKIMVSVVDPGDATKGIAQYTVKVDLPGAPQFTGYSVPITAFIDVNKDGLPAGEPSNITIDRVYTNYLKLEKKARLLDSNGNALTGTDASASIFTTDQSILSPAATPGRIIEYQITYTNVSTSGGTNSVILPAKSLVITEDGTAGNNSWFSLTTDPKYPANLTTGSAIPAATTTVSGDASNIKIYINSPGDIAPQGTGTFTFQRKINGSSTPAPLPPG